MLKETREGLRAQPGACILNPNAQIVRFDLTGGDQHLSSALTDCAHRLQGVENKVEHNLLKLDPVRSCRKRRPD